MATRNVRNANYFQVDKEVSIRKVEGVEILKSKEAWEKFKWVRRFYDKKPKEGYFIWAKKQVNIPLSTCIFLCSPLKQNLQNLVVVEKNLRVNFFGYCLVKKKSIGITHNVKGKFIIKEGSSVRYVHFHKWGFSDRVKPFYEFILAKNANLDYTYKCFSSPLNLNLHKRVIVKENSKVDLKIFIDCKNCKVSTKEEIELLEKNSKGSLKIRVVGRENSRIIARSKIIGKENSRGHIDCKGLIVGRKSTISLIPELLNLSKNALLTHEASIGRIEEEQLDYLRSRGFSKKKAIDLLVRGFLRI